MSLQSREDLIAELRRKEFRDAFVSSRVSNTLALQIRTMRQERGWSQAQLAERLGTSQNAIYRLESPRYGKATVTTLKRLASIFDVGLAVWFVPFSELVDKFTNLSTESILVPSFDNDPGFHEREAASAQVHTPVTVSINPLLSGSYSQITVSGASGGTWSLQVYPETSGLPTAVLHHRDETLLQPLSIKEVKLRGEIRYGRRAPQRGTRDSTRNNHEGPYSNRAEAII